MNLKKILGTGLAASALFVSGAATAATRSADAMPATTPVELTRSAAAVDGESEMVGEGSILLVILAVAAIIAGIIVAANGGNDSPG